MKRTVAVPAEFADIPEEELLKLGYGHIPLNKKEISEREIEEISGKEQARKGKIIDKIIFLESQQTKRRIRDHALGRDDGWLQDLDDQIELLRSQL